METRDAYKLFFAEFNIDKEQFFEFGLSQIIYSPKEKAAHQWAALKQNILQNEPVYIRGFGQKSANSYLFQNFYRDVFNHSQIHIDPLNNRHPMLLIEELTGYSKRHRKGYVPIRNYQVAHIFGRTKNVYAFTAPWNIAYIPKVLDPFTGHEAKGSMVAEFTNLFQKKSFEHFEPLINDYNKLITSPELLDKVEQYLASLKGDRKDIDKLTKAIRTELAPINL